MSFVPHLRDRSGEGPRAGQATVGARAARCGAAAAGADHARGCAGGPCRRREHRLHRRGHAGRTRGCAGARPRRDCRARAGRRGAERRDRSAASPTRCSRGAGQALVLPADVPLATPGELRSLIQSRGEQPGVTLAPSHDSNGTNGLLLAPPNAIAPCYGPGSYLQHMSQAMARRVDVNVVHLDGLARDIDEPADLALLLAHRACRQRATLSSRPTRPPRARLQPNPQGNDQ